jgi:hypothetical protein
MRLPQPEFRFSLEPAGLCLGVYRRNSACKVENRRSEREYPFSDLRPKSSWSEEDSTSSSTAIKYRPTYSQRPDIAPAPLFLLPQPDIGRTWNTCARGQPVTDDFQKDKPVEFQFRDWIRLLGAGSADHTTQERRERKGARHVCSRPHCFRVGRRIGPRTLTSQRGDMPNLSCVQVSRTALHGA